MKNFQSMLEELNEIERHHKLRPGARRLINEQIGINEEYLSGKCEWEEMTAAAYTLHTILHLERVRERRDARYRKHSPDFIHKPAANKKAAARWLKLIERQLCEAKENVHSARIEAIKERMKCLDAISEEELIQIWIEARSFNVEQDFRKRNGLTSKQKIRIDIELGAKNGIIKYRI